MIDIDDRLDVAGAFQTAIYAHLTGTPAVAALVGNRVFDRVSKGAAFPYVTIPDVQLVEDGADCFEGDEIFLDIHVWSRAVGSMEAKAIVGALRRSLHGADLNLGANHALVDLQFRGQQDAGSDDPLTTHLIARFYALTETVSA